MTVTQILRSTAVALAGAAVIAQGALAAGEPKNEWPFTRPVAERSLQAAGVAAAATPSVGGEPKNEWPFTRPVGGRSLQTAGRVVAAATPNGEPKNQPPFTQPASQPTAIVVQGGGGFSWTDGAIGLAAGLGLALGALGIATLVRGSRHSAVLS